MVLLVMTHAVAEAVALYVKSGGYQVRNDEQPSLESPAVGNPISHSQLIEISRHLRSNPQLLQDAQSQALLPSIHLSDLVKGCDLYIPPPPPKPEQTEEYKLLMARLRADQESRSYNLMLQPGPQPETFNQRFPTSTYGHLFPPQASSSSRYPNGTSTGTSAEEDEVTYADINRQLTMVANVLISIVACSVSVWKAAWHWDVPARLALSMVSSIVVAVAEVAIYAGYIGRLDEARGKERMKVERKEIAESWVIEAKPLPGNGSEWRVKEKEIKPLVESSSRSELKQRVGKKIS